MFVKIENWLYDEKAVGCVEGLGDGIVPKKFRLFDVDSALWRKVHVDSVEEFDAYLSNSADPALVFDNVEKGTKLGMPLEFVHIHLVDSENTTHLIVINGNIYFMSNDGKTVDRVTV